MRIFRRVIMPIAWLVVFAVIAVALVKIAFVDGLRAEPALAGPAATIATPVFQASRTTVTNRVEVEATVQSDAAADVRNTVAGTVNHVFLEPGAPVRNGDPLFQVRSEVQPEAGTAPAAVAPAGGNAEQDSAPAMPAAAKPTYTYTNVLAASTGVLKTLTVIIDQQVSVGEVAGTVDPGTFTVSGTVDAAQQYRLLAKPGSAEISVIGGPAPFSCADPVLTSIAAASEGSGSGGTAGVARSVAAAIMPVPGNGAPAAGGAATGRLSCPVPADITVFAGLGATMTVTAGESVNVIAVPLTAVRGTVADGIVWMAAPAPEGAANGAANGTATGADAAAPPAAEPEQRTVKLGLNDGAMVEVVSGLAEGDAILEFVPGAPGQPDAGIPGAYPMGG
ncbi:hypothetical protein [Arthrobacter sp. Leaf141]|uniref:hypothetical protein n=1 Tax=Arthrobacter sp. Leaf141 TaxID=1736273 RepID=UPI000AFD58FA|nr:hypothetical protein [Arthrobacter sp. Leaf141]